ncbi:YciE/YciF ferroxidase family protein [Flavisolibacter nicotianae]|uniref:YciE/YciF ferroxidase family protein n=1 Tax=Flavisolibacter nicotianae TaxID=2364882 RepID=UPI000EB4D32F|nr:ferritin-like domain-containing protein [Flavisolibacter nicotianae]
METAPLNTATNSKLKAFFIEQLQDIYWAERKFVKKLPKLADAATTQQLKDALANHLSQTKTHVERLEKVFALIGEKAEAKKCPAMAGIFEEGEDIVDETDEGSAQRDVGIVFAAQKAEHYEIATYGGLAQLAKTLGYGEAKDLLGQTLEEEKGADLLLTQIAESGINYQASREKE